MTQSRKRFYSRTVSLTGGAAVTLASVMLANGWTSTDEFDGAQLTIKPASATLYIGDDANVRDASGVGVYQGFPVASGVVQEVFNEGSSIDPNAIYLYSVGTQNIAILFHAS